MEDTLHFGGEWTDSWEGAGGIFWWVLNILCHWVAICFVICLEPWISGQNLNTGRRGGGTGGHIAASTRITNSSSNPLTRPFLSLKHRTSLQTHSVSRLFLQDKDYYYTRLGSHLYSAESSEIVTNITPVVESAAAAAADLEEQEVEEVVEKSVATSTTTRVTGDTPLGQPGGKVGIVNYYNKGQEELHFDEGLPAAAPAYDTRKDWSSRLWVVGPLFLVLSVVGPPLYLRKIFEAILEDSLVTGLCKFSKSCFSIINPFVSSCAIDWCWNNWLIGLEIWNVGFFSPWIHFLQILWSCSSPKFCSMSAYHCSSSLHIRYKSSRLQPGRLCMEASSHLSGTT